MATVVTAAAATLPVTAKYRMRRRETRLELALSSWAAGAAAVGIDVTAS